MRTDKEQVERVREEIQSIIDRWDYDVSKTTSEKIDEILSIPSLRIASDDQSLPALTKPEIAGVCGRFARLINTSKVRIGNSTLAEIAKTHQLRKFKPARFERTILLKEEK